MNFRIQGRSRNGVSNVSLGPLTPAVRETRTVPDQRESGIPDQRESGIPDQRESGIPDQREAGIPDQRETQRVDSKNHRNIYRGLS